MANVIDIVVVAVVCNDFGYVEGNYIWAGPDETFEL
jgi:hypothetical protein